MHILLPSISSYHLDETKNTCSKETEHRILITKVCTLVANHRDILPMSEELYRLSSPIPTELFDLDVMTDEIRISLRYFFSTWEIYGSAGEPPIGFRSGRIRLKVTQIS